MSDGVCNESRNTSASQWPGQAQSVAGSSPVSGRVKLSQLAGQASHEWGGREAGGRVSWLAAGRLPEKEKVAGETHLLAGPSTSITHTQTTTATDARTGTQTSTDTHASTGTLTGIKTYINIPRHSCISSPHPHTPSGTHTYTLIPSWTTRYHLTLPAGKHWYYGGFD